MATEENKDKLLYTREKIKQSLSEALKEVHSVSIEQNLKSNNMLSVSVNEKTQGAIAVKTDMIAEVEGEYVLDNVKTIDKMTDVLVRNAEAYKKPEPAVIVTESTEKGKDDSKEHIVVRPEPVTDKKKQIRNVILSTGLTFALGLRNRTSTR